MTSSNSQPKNKDIEDKKRQSTDYVNEACPQNLQADDIIAPCDCNIRAVYPVRYAYSNLYGDKNAKAAMPPSITTLLELCPADPSIELYEAEPCSIEETDGFSARLLREGWVYVFEEGEYSNRSGANGQGDLLIFKHIINYYYQGQTYNNSDSDSGSDKAKEACSAGDAEEGFIPYYLIRDTKTKELKLQEQSKQYPYLPIKKDVASARFLFSDIQLSNYTVNKMRQDVNFRNAFMQEINLHDFEQNPYAVEATEEHIENLIEDYKSESSKFRYYIEQAKKIGVNLPGSYFSNVSEVPDITKNIESLTNQLKTTLDYEEKSALIILHDPVGYQKDILSLYTLVTSAYVIFQKYWSYPNQIGHYIEQLKLNIDSDEMYYSENGQRIRRIFEDNIDEKGWSTYWPEIELAYKEFDVLQANIIKLYHDFLTNSIIKNQIGSLKNYIDHVFLIEEQYKSDRFWHEDFFNEFAQYCQLHEMLLAPLNSSGSGREVLDLLFSKEPEYSYIWGGVINNLLKILNELAIKDKDSKDKDSNEYKKQLLPSLRSVTLICFDALGYSFTKTHKQLNKTTQRTRKIDQTGLNFMAEKVLPQFLTYFGVTVSFDVLEYLTGNQFLHWMNSIAPDPIISNNSSNEMKKVFDWDNQLKNHGEKAIFPTAKFMSLSISSANGISVNKPVILQGAKIGSDIYSLITGIIALHTTSCTSELDKNNPLNLGARNIFYVKMTTSLAATTKTIISLQEAAGVYSLKVSHPSIRLLLTKIKFPEIKSPLGKFAIKSIGYLVAALSIGLSIMEARSEFAAGNEVAGYAKCTEAAGIFSFTVGMGLVGYSGSIKLFSMAALYASWIILAGVILTVGAIIIYNIFSTDPFEKLLKNCFWGNGDKYFAGGYEISEDQDIERPDDKMDQLGYYNRNYENFQNYYQIEIQEFLNIFFSPQLKIEAIAKPASKVSKHYYGGIAYIIKYEFELNNFQLGLSEIEYRLVEREKTILYPSQMPVKALPPKMPVVIKSKGRNFRVSINKQFNELFEQAFNDAINKTKLQNGSLRVSFTIDAGIYAVNPITAEEIPSIYWYYIVDRQEKSIAPLRYRDNNLNDKIFGFINSENAE